MPILAVLLFVALPTSDELKACPEVASIEVRSVQNPTNRIIHVLNWHYVSPEDYAVDAPDQSYESFLDDVEAIQLEQVKFLKRLKVRSVRYEGLTDKNREAYIERANTLKKLRPIKNDSPTGQLLAEFRRTDELQLGSPGRLLMAGGIDAVLPGDDAEAMEKANPVKDGKIAFDEKLNETREDAVVKLLLKEKESVIVMGGSHDLTDNLPPTVEYVRVTLTRYRDVTKR